MSALTLTPTDDCAQSPAPTICNLIQTAQAEKERLSQERAQRLQAQIAQAHQAARAQLGETLYGELSLLTLQFIYHTDSSGNFEWLRYELNPDKLRAMELAPFHLYITASHGWGYALEHESKWSVEFRQVSRYHELRQDAAHAAEFFHAMHQIILDQRADARKEQIKALCDKLGVKNYYSQVETQDAADTVLAELLALDPANESEYRALHAKMSAKLDADRQAKERTAHETAEREARAQQRAAECLKLGAEYRTAYQAYWDELYTIAAHNAGVKAKWQAKLDADTFDVWELEYALVAESEEDSERIIETANAYLLNGYVTNAWGEYQVLEKHGNVVLRAYRHEVSKEAPQAWKASEHKPYAVQITVGETHFYLSPHKQAAQFEIAKQIEAEMKNTTGLVEPEAPAGLPDRGGMIGETWCDSAKDIRNAIRDAKPIEGLATNENTYDSAW